MEENKMEEYDMMWNKDGGINSKVTYPETPIEIQVGKEKFVVGVQPSYDVANNIAPDKVQTLKAYLCEQKALLETRIKAAKDVMKSTEGFDLEGLKESIDKIPVEKLKMKKLEPLNELARRVVMRQDASKSLVVLEKNMGKIQEQIDFINSKTD